MANVMESSPFPSINIKFGDKKRNIRNDGLTEVVRALLHPDNAEFHGDHNAVIDGILTALSKGVDSDLVSRAVSMQSIVNPECRGLGSLSEKLMSRVSSDATDENEVGDFSVCLGVLSLFCGHYNDALLRLPGTIVACLLNTLEKCILKHAKYQTIEKLLVALNCAVCGLTDQHIGGWVYSGLVYLLVGVMVMYPESYASHHITRTALFNLLVHIIHVNNEEELDRVFIDTKASFNMQNEEDDDDEYFYSSDEIVLPAIRWSFKGVIEKLERLESGEIETEFAITPSDVKKLVKELKLAMTEMPFDQDQATIDLFMHDWESRCLFYAIKTATIPSNLLDLMKASMFIQNLFYVEEKEGVIFSKNKADVLLRKKSNKKKEMQLSQNRREKFNTLYNEN